MQCKCIAFNSAICVQTYRNRNAYKMNILLQNIYVNARHLQCEVRGLLHFKVPEIPPTTNKTIRFPIDVVEEVENVIKGRDCTFTAFVVAAVRLALEQVKLDEAD